MSEMPLWKPSAERVHNSQMRQFIDAINIVYKLDLNSYADLYAWSIAEPEKFWAEIWCLADIKAQQPYQQVRKLAAQFWRCEWFVGAHLNFAENLLRFRDNHTALICIGEDGRRQELTYAQLYDSVAGLAASLAEFGVGPGDRVAGLLPNCAEAVIAMLATTSLGAIWSSCSPDFGVAAVEDRFGQIEPKVLFVCDGYYFKGKTIAIDTHINQLVAKLPSLKTAVLVPYLDKPQNDLHLPLFAQLIKPDQQLNFVSMPANAPVYILFSSGTTGKPKGIVHGAIGTLVQHAKELILHSDLSRSSCLFFYSTCGWMMWNWLVSGLMTGARLVLYDGSPLHPGPQRLLDLVDSEAVTHLGASAKYYAALDKAGLKPRITHRLTSLQTLLSTGSPLLPETFEYIYADIKQDLCVASISGGTDIISCFALGNPMLPVYRGQLQCRGLGMDVAFVDEQGRELIGQKGELVCRAPFPSMPVAFWQDPGDEKYKNSYFARSEKCWMHGDYGMLTPENGVIIYGRSDTVLNPGGVRIGTAEIYRQVEKCSEVLDCVAIGQSWHDDERIILFVVLRPGVVLDEVLVQKLKTTIRTGATPRHVPAKIIAVADVPRTINGKISEVAVRELVHKRPVKNQEALANPEALLLFIDLPELIID